MTIKKELFQRVYKPVIYRSLKFEELDDRGIFIKIMTLDIGTQTDAKARTLNVN